MKFITRKFSSCILPASILVLLSSGSAQADILGVYMTAGIWNPDISGYISDNGPNINIVNDLAFNDDSSKNFSFALEHPLFMLPNIKIKRTALDTNSATVIDSEINFGGITFPANSSLNSQIDLSHTDYIAYYEILDNWVSIDLGLTIMHFDGNININATNLSSNVNLDDYVPAFYGKVNVELPLTGLYVGTQGSLLSIGDSSISDYNIYIGWESDAIIGVEVGYQRFEADWEGFDNSDGNLSFDGYYASVTFHF